MALDGLMHLDVHPFAPWSAENPLLIPGSFGWVHLVCALVGLAGGLLWLRHQGRP